jgi:hypothetical protein
VPAAEYKERAPLMFKLDAAGPTASGRPAITRTVTKEDVQSAWWAANNLCDDYGKALSNAYGNFDRIVALGWLLADVALGCLIEKADAFKAGGKAGKLARGLQSEFDAPARRLGKRKRVSDEDWAAAAHEAAGIRKEIVELPLPMRPPPAPRAPRATSVPPAQPAAPTPAAPPPVAIERHRVEPPAPAPNGERLQLLKAVRAAEAAVSQAECALAAAKRDRDKARAAWEYAREQASNKHVIDQIWDKPDEWAAWTKQNDSNMEAARARLLAAERAIGPPEDALHWAKHEANEARFELKEYERERSRQDVWQLRMADMDAEHEEKVRQIEAGIANNNALYNPGDPGYWDPDAREAALLYRLWKVQ